jgi:hypothetical protein
MAGYSSRTLAQKLGIRPATRVVVLRRRPKKTSGVDSDLTEDVVRATGLDQGLVDVKVCAVDAVWSGLTLVRRVTNRAR